MKNHCHKLLRLKNYLGGYIKKINIFTEQKKEIQNEISNFDQSELKSLEKGLEKAQNDQHECEYKINSFKKEIDENHTNTPDIVNKIENKLKRFSNTDYHILYQTQN